MELLHRFKPCNLAIATLLGLLTSSSLWAADTTQQSEDEWKFTLKNAYINRNFDNDTLKDTGSWSQAASLFYKSKMHDTPLVIADKPITIGEPILSHNFQISFMLKLVGLKKCRHEMKRILKSFRSLQMALPKNLMA